MLKCVFYTEKGSHETRNLPFIFLSLYADYRTLNLKCRSVNDIKNCGLDSKCWNVSTFFFFLIDVYKACLNRLEKLTLDKKNGWS